MYEFASHGLDPTVTASLVGTTGLIIVALLGLLTASRPHRQSPTEKHAALTDAEYHKQLLGQVAGCEHDAAILENDYRDLRVQFEGLVARRRAFEQFLAYRGFDPDRITSGKETDSEAAIHAPR